MSRVFYRERSKDVPGSLTNALGDILVQKGLAVRNKETERDYNYVLPSLSAFGQVPHAINVYSGKNGFASVENASIWSPSLDRYHSMSIVKVTPQLGDSWGWISRRISADERNEALLKDIYTNVERVYQQHGFVNLTPEFCSKVITSDGWTDPDRRKVLQVMLKGCNLNDFFPGWAQDCIAIGKR